MHWEVTAHRAANHRVNYNVRGAHTGRGALGYACGAQSQQPVLSLPSLPFAPSKSD